MIPVTIYMEPQVLRFYAQVAERMDFSLEQVLTDALFTLAGELSMEALGVVEKTQ